MPDIEIITSSKAQPEICFQLALSVDLHAILTQQIGEYIVAGVRTGVLQLGDLVTFRARHFGIWQTFTSQITALTYPSYFRDEMQQGAFKSMHHEHNFETTNRVTCMRDSCAFASPLGWLGKLVDALVLEKYMRRFLLQRCAVVKHYAESGAWREILPA